MSNFLANLSNLVRGIVSLAVVGLIGGAGWVGYQHFTAGDALQRQVSELADRNAALAKQAEQLSARNEQLDLAVRLLKTDHRLAEIRVLDQWKTKDSGRLMTRLSFTEIDDQGRPLDKKPRTFTIEGDLVYIDAWVVKYLDEFVETGDPLRGTSICLFRRLYGEYQEPIDGFRLDEEKSRPLAYSRGSQMPEAEREVWTHFWEYANNPDKSHKAGIRALHGEAPSVKLQPGKRYLLDLRASSGLEIKTEDLPPGDGNQL